MLLLSAIGYQGKLLSERADDIQDRFVISFYDREDIRLVDTESRERIEKI